MFFDLVLGLKNLFLKIKYRDTYCDIILSMAVNQIVVPPPPDHETRDLISTQGYNTLQKRLLIELQWIAPNLTTYQSGSVAPAQIISNGKYVLEHGREIKKLKADLNYFIQDIDPENPEKPRITSLDYISADTVTELLEFLKKKGYQERNIAADLGARIKGGSCETRNDLLRLSKPVE
jgi:hypothetical protein